MTDRAERSWLVALVALAVVWRWPFLAVALDTAVDGDTAIVGLMARHPGQGSTLWGQPYGSPLDSWVALPFVAVLGASTLALRLPYFVLSLALVPLAWALARRLHPAAGLPAALAAAAPPAYFLLLSGLAPPFYPTTLVLLALVLLVSHRPVAAGLVSGLALWTHLLALTVVVPVAAMAAIDDLRGRPRTRLLRYGAALVAAAAPLLWRMATDPYAAGGVGWSGLHESLQHAATIVPHLPWTIAGVLGAHAPYTAGDPELRAEAPLVVAVAIGLSHLALVASAIRRLRDRPLSWVLLATIAITVVLFPLSLRSAPTTLRFLTPLWLPLVALGMAGLAAAGGRRLAFGGAALLVAMHAPAALGLAAAWRAPGPWQPLVPECGAIAAELERRGIGHAYASYNTAWCLTWTSGERVVASQPWNERFPGYPLPLLDRVRGASDTAWVLVAGADFDMPSPRLLAAKIEATGGSAETTTVGPATIFHSFRPPFATEGLPLAVPSEPGAVMRLGIPDPRPLHGLTIAAAPGARLPDGLEIEVSRDGDTWEAVLSRKPSRARLDLVWVNGHPEFSADGQVVSVTLDGRPVSAIRIRSRDGSPVAIGSALVHDWREER